MDDFFAELYNVDDARDREIFGDLYHPPAGLTRFPSHEWVHVATIHAPSDGDGQTVEIDEARYPARFFRLRALEGVNSVGEPKPAYFITTGSGDEVGALVVAIGKQIAGGMLGFHPGLDDDAPVKEESHA